MKKTILLLIISIPSIALADIYKWKDEQGTIHFSDITVNPSGDTEKLVESGKTPQRQPRQVFEEPQKNPQIVKKPVINQPNREVNSPEVFQSKEATNAVFQPLFDFLRNIIAMIIIGGIIIAAIGLILNRLKEKRFFKKWQPWPYYKKEHAMTQNERSFFETLRKATNDKYYIFPQIRLSSILDITEGPKGKDKKWHYYFWKINQKSVDYLICEKLTLSTLLVIELDDSSHNNPKRQERDKFVNEALKEAGVPILRIPFQTNYNMEQMEKELTKNLPKTKV